MQTANVNTCNYGENILSQLLKRNIGNQILMKVMQ